MKRFAADNLLFLRKSYPNIYEAVRNRSTDSGRLQPAEAQNGQPIVIIRRAEGEMPLYSRYNPDVEAARWAASIHAEIEDSDNVLLFGFGFGYHAQAALTAYPDKKWFIYEPDLDMFLLAIEKVDLRPVLDRPQIAMLAIGEDPLVHENMLLNILSSAKGSFSFVVLPAYRKLYKQLLESFSGSARKTALKYEVNVNTLRRFRKEWIENTFVNLARTLHTRSFYGLRDACRGIPAVVAGSGPSLEMEMEHLVKVRDRILLIAAGSAARPLLHHGVEPDLIVSIDGGEANHRIFEPLEVGHIPFLYVPALKHTVIRNERSDYLLHAFLSIDYLAMELMDLQNEHEVIFLPTFTVTGTAIQAAAWMGCRDVVLIGQDFSYPDGKIYAEGFGLLSAQRANKLLEQADLLVPNVAGGQNRTRKSMLALKQDTEAVMERLPGVRFYNASPIGAVIEHTSLLSLKQLPDHLGAEPLASGWIKSLVLEKAKPVSPERTEKILQSLQQFIRQFDEWNSHFQQLDQTIRQIPLPAATDGSFHRKITSWLSAFETHWQKVIDHAFFRRFVLYYVSGEYHHARRHWPELVTERDLEEKLKLLLVTTMPMINAARDILRQYESGLSGWEEKVGRSLRVIERKD